MSVWLWYLEYLVPAEGACVLWPERPVVWPWATIPVLSAQISKTTPNDVSDPLESLSS